MIGGDLEGRSGSDVRQSQRASTRLEDILLKRGGGSSKRVNGRGEARVNGQKTARKVEISRARSQPEEEDEQETPAVQTQVQND